MILHFFLDVPVYVCVFVCVCVRNEAALSRDWTQVSGALMALFHCMVRHGTVRYGSLLGGFPLGTVPGTWYFFSTTSVEVPCEPVPLPKRDV